MLEVGFCLINFNAGQCIALTTMGSPYNSNSIITVMSSIHDDRDGALSVYEYQHTDGWQY